ncbi:MAG: DUF4249 domain-containing protein [Cyclobacteriaceae bacterium]|nr:DUF4249 domain-containing protein [Cyclobacteriaceae bacterium]
MRPTPAIDEVSFIFGEKPNGDLGAQVYIDTHDPDNNTWYYRWEWQETWEFRTPYNSYIYYDEGEIKLREEDINTCWKSGRSTSIEVATSKNLSSDHISDYPIHFVSAKTDRLNFRYSMLVKQFALSEESYVFWNEMKKFTETLGTLFDPQPSVIKGNIHNVADDKEIVIGYFDASEVKEQRIFIRNSDLPSIRFPNYFSSCEDTIVSEDMIPAMLATNYMLVAEEMDMTGLPVYLFSTAGCVDCTKYGTNVKPPFWN